MLLFYFILLLFFILENIETGFLFIYFFSNFILFLNFT